MALFKFLKNKKLKFCNAKQNMVEPGRIELPTSCVQGKRSPSWAMAPKKQYKYCNFDFLQGKTDWAYANKRLKAWRRKKQNLVGLGGFEPPTSPLSGVRSNQLSYRPKLFVYFSFFCVIFLLILVI